MVCVSATPRLHTSRNLASSGMSEMRTSVRVRGGVDVGSQHPDVSRHGTQTTQ